MVTANFRTNRLRPKIAIVLLFIITTAMFLTGSAATTEIKDIDIILAVDRQLQDDQEVPAYLIGVRTRDGIVTLGGLVNNLLACERAADVAATIKGVRSVVNRIDVLPVLRTDDQIRKDVELALFDDPATDLFDIQVHARNGTVILSGMADSWQEQKLCVQVAKGVIGVKAVKSNIKVSQRSKRPDVEIGVTVNNQLVILNGRVDSGLEKAKAGDVASAVKGVVSMTNNLQVNRTWIPKDDREIKKDIQDELWWSPFVDENDVSVRVTDGIATLDGVVDTLRERRVATENAYEGGPERCATT